MTYCEHITSHSFLKSLPYRRDNPPPHPNPAAMSRSYFCLFLDYHTAIIGLIGKLHVVAVDEQHPRRWSTGHFQAKKKNKFRFNASWWPHRPQGCRQPLRRWKKSLFYRSDEQMVDICLTRTFFSSWKYAADWFSPPALGSVCVLPGVRSGGNKVIQERFIWSVFGACPKGSCVPGPKTTNSGNHLPLQMLIRCFQKRLKIFHCMKQQIRGQNGLFGDRPKNITTSFAHKD